MPNKIDINSIKWDEPTPSVGKKLNEGLYGMAENALNMATGIPASLIGMAAGVGTQALVTDKTLQALGIEGGVTNAAQNVERNVSDFLTYKPRSEQGQVIQEQINKPVSVLGATPQPILSIPANIGREVVKPILQSYDAPEGVQYVTNKGAEVAGYVAGGKLVKGAKGELTKVADAIKEKTNLKGIEDVIPQDGIKLSEVKWDEPKPVTQEPMANTTAQPIKVAPEATSQEPIGITKPAKAALDINQKILEKGFNELPKDELAQYNTITKEGQKNLVGSLLTDENKLFEIAKSNEPMPAGVSPQYLFNVAKSLAEKKGDIDLMRDLAQSPIAEQRSVIAQQLGASAWENSPTDTVSRIMEVKKAREAQVVKPEIITREKVALKKETNNILLPKEELMWDNFLRKIAC